MLQSGNSSEGGVYLAVIINLNRISGRADTDCDTGMPRGEGYKYVTDYRANVNYQLQYRTSSLNNSEKR